MPKTQNLPGQRFSRCMEQRPVQRPQCELRRSFRTRFRPCLAVSKNHSLKGCVQWPGLPYAYA